LTRVHYLGVELTVLAPAQDRRVRRSRSALMRAAVELVSERGTANVPISDLAEAADVSRQVLYQQFGDRETLLLEAALDLARRELVGEVSAESPGRAKTLAVARHFAGHRAYYRAVLTSSCGFALNQALTSLILPANRRILEEAIGARLDARTVEDLARFVTGGWGAVINTWVVEGADPLDPEEFTDRLMGVASAIFAALGVKEVPR
jgi:AcrR family transcriptional regulator